MITLKELLNQKTLGDIISEQDQREENRKKREGQLHALILYLLQAEVSKNTNQITSNLLAKIPDFIPPPLKGDSYVLTEDDKQVIAKSIKVPIVEKVIEKTEIREVPIVTEITKENDVTSE